MVTSCIWKLWQFQASWQDLYFFPTGYFADWKEVFGKMFGKLMSRAFMWKTSLPETIYSELSIKQKLPVSYEKTQYALEVKTNFHKIGAETSYLISVHFTWNTGTSDLEFSRFQWIPNSLKGSSKTKGNYENSALNFSNKPKAWFKPWRETCGDWSRLGHQNWR